MIPKIPTPTYEIESTNNDWVNNAYFVIFRFIFSPLFPVGFILIINN